MHHRHLHEDHRTQSPFLKATASGASFLVAFQSCSPRHWPGLYLFVLSACSVYLYRMSANGAAVIAHAVICTAHGRNLRSWAGRDRSDTVRLTARAWPWACPVARRTVDEREPRRKSKNSLAQTEPDERRPTSRTTGCATASNEENGATQRYSVKSVSVETRRQHTVRWAMCKNHANVTVQPRWDWVRV